VAAAMAVFLNMRHTYAGYQMDLLKVQSYLEHVWPAARNVCCEQCSQGKAGTIYASCGLALC